MNVTFHIVAAVGITAALSFRKRNASLLQMRASSQLPFLVAAFVAGVLLHGLLDWLPHSYPINSAADVGIGGAILSCTMIFVRQEHRLLLGACAFGSVFPDLVDLGPAILNKRLGWSLPVFKFFPWHWRQYSGSIYDGSQHFESVLYHLLVVSASLVLMYVYRQSLFAIGEKAQ
jgi:hypothetical protein